MKSKGINTMPKTEYVIEPGKQEITSTVVLDAPRELVFRAYTEPELFAKWWGPRQYTNIIDKFDARQGGEWRVIQKAADGDEHAFRGVHHEVSAPERLVVTFEYEGMPGHVALQIATFEPIGNKTKVVAHTVFEAVADRDGMVASGMQEGADESIERLAELLDSLKSGR
jgi:uncharacterized protein YndB with AHSA1/START domain